jgi:heat-inducible transcriptional repressor
MTMADQPLDERKERILREIVETYIREGDPVGSRSVADASQLNVSSATVRNEMSILEREGYVSHPHTSAGRVPTDKGYRYYVDVLSPRVGSDPDRRREIEEMLTGTLSAMDELLQTASELLTELTNYTSLASAPPIGEAHMHRLEVIQLGGHRLLLVMIGEGGWHEERLLELASEPEEDAVGRAVQRANAVVDGRSVSDAAAAIEGIGATQRETQILHAFAEALRTTSHRTGRVYTGGASKLIVWEAAPRARQLLEMLEARNAEPLLPDPAPDGVTVRIGSELALEHLENLSLIAAGYRLGQRAGTLGVIGPTRMDYPLVIGAVADVAASLSRVLRQLEG